MPLFVAVCIDKPGSLAVRMAAREDHFAYVRANPGVVKLGGPFLDEAGEMAGSLIVFEAESLEAAKAFNRADPYVLAGLFERVEIRPWKATFGAIA
ncbi:MAG TPA: YciI family protein [Phenylobacterium sp.]